MPSLNHRRHLEQERQVQRRLNRVGEMKIVNEQILKMLPGESVAYLSADSVNCDNNEEAQNYPMHGVSKFTNTLRYASSLPKPKSGVHCDVTS